MRELPIRQAGFYRRLREVYLALDRALAAEVATYGLRMSHVRILLALSTYEHRTQRELASDVSTTESTVLVTLRAMLASKIVSRTPSPTDGRKHEIRITPKGMRLVEEIRVLTRGILAVAFDGMRAAEIEAVMTGLERIESRIAARYDVTP